MAGAAAAGDRRPLHLLSSRQVRPSWSLESRCRLPIETADCSPCRIEPWIPVGYKKAVVRHSGAIGADGVVDQRSLQKAIRRMKVVEIKTRADTVGTIDFVIDFSKSQILHRFARVGTGQGLQIAVGGAALRSRYRLRAWQRKLRGAGEVDRKDFSRSIVGQKIKEFVLDQGAAHAAPKLLLLMDRLRIDSGGLRYRIEGVERWIAQKVKQVSVNCVSARFRDRIHNPAGRLPELRAVISGTDLKLPDRIQAVYIKEPSSRPARSRRKPGRCSRHP